MARVVTWQDFADYLRAIRESRRLSQRGLAEQIGCTALHIWKLEHGQRHPSKMMLVLLRRNFLLRSEDALVFTAFEKMVEYRCDVVEMEDGHHHDP